MSSSHEAEERVRKSRERFEASVHTLAIVALAKEIYSDTDRARLLAEFAALIAAHDAAVAVEPLPETASAEERTDRARLVVRRVRGAHEAIALFAKNHPLIRTMHWQVKNLTSSLDN